MPNPSVPYIITGKILDLNGDAVSGTNGGIVWLEYDGHIEKIATTSQGYFTYDLKNLPSAYSVTDGNTLLIRAMRIPSASSTTFLIKNVLHTIDIDTGIYDSDITLEKVKYETIKKATQAVIYYIIKNDPLIVHFNLTVVERTPENLTRGVGFPYVIIRTPTVDEKRITFTKYQIVVSPQIEIHTKKAEKSKQIADAVRDALKSNTSTTQTADLNLHAYRKDDVTDDFLPDEKNTPVIVQTSNPEYEWVGG